MTKQERSLVKAGNCRLCGEPIVYDPERFAWTHKQPGADHGPAPEVERRKVRHG